MAVAFKHLICYKFGVPIYRFLLGADLYKRVVRRAKSLGLTPGGYLQKLAWRDLSGHVERQALRKTKK